VSRHTRSRRRWILYSLPALALSLLFVAIPTIESVRLSFFDWPGFGDAEFIGFDNYIELAQDAVARRALWNTIVFAVATAVGTVAIGTIIAIAVERRIPAASTFKFLIFLPVFIPVVFTARVWLFGLDPTLGWANAILGAIHPALDRPWLGDPATALWAIIAISILQYVGFPMIIVLAALQDIPREILDAARVDGASTTQTIVHVTLPLIRDVLATIFLLQLIFGFLTFDQVFIMTGGGPGNATEIMSTFVYQEAFIGNKFGYGATAGVVTAALIATIAMLYVTALRPARTEYVG
jgi:ABC-type sugar transport system permease subunit